MAYLPRAQRRAQIIEAAIALMVAEGLAATTVRAVAGAVGTSVGQIHHHFVSADALRAEAFREIGRRLADKSAAEAATMKPLERVISMVDRSPTPSDGHDRLMCEAMSAASLDPLLRSAVGETVRLWRSQLTEALAAVLAERGVTTAVDLDAASGRLVTLTICRDAARDCGILDGFDGMSLRAHVEVELRMAKDSPLQDGAGGDAVIHVSKSQNAR